MKTTARTILVTIMMLGSTFAVGCHKPGTTTTKEEAPATEPAQAPLADTAKPAETPAAPPEAAAVPEDKAAATPAPVKEIDVKLAAPAPKIEFKGAAPSPSHLWTPGHWMWT